jgi:ferritin-like metal-binding protein YciE
MKTDTLQDLYMKELRDLYGSEKLLAKWLPKVMETADLIELRQALNHHLNEVRSQMTRLEKIFQIRGEKPTVKNGKALEGILQEADDDIAEAGNANIRDTAIVAAIQQIKHYEMAAYGTMLAYATHLDYTEDGRLLQATLQEERATDRKLTEIALRYLKLEAARIA